MEVFEYGHIKPLARTCRNCGAVVGVTPMDLKQFRCDIPAIREEGRVNDQKNLFRSNCCICGTAITIGVSEIPKSWRELRCMPEEYRYHLDKFYPGEEKET